MIRSFLHKKFYFLFLILSFNSIAQEKIEFTEISLKEFESNYSLYKKQELFTKYSCTILNHPITTIQTEELSNILRSFEQVAFFEIIDNKVDILITHTGNNKYFSEIEKKLKSNNILIERNKNISIVTRQKIQ